MMADLISPGESSDQTDPIVPSRFVRFAPLARRAAAGPWRRLRNVVRHILCRSVANTTSASSTLVAALLLFGMPLSGTGLSGTGLRAQNQPPAGQNPQPQGQPRLVEGPDTITFSMNENNGME